MITGPCLSVLVLLLASTLLLSCTNAGPLPSNVTSTELTTQGACAGVSCGVRAGCKALHRPDACCPAYQCECEQDGRLYLNGEKLVDPLDPCRVCYCQGGEVVCRRIACFTRDDCRPRTVAGRCCPEYDNCPLTGESTMLAAAEEATSSVPPPPSPPREVPKQEITIKEITPVSEIPAIVIANTKEIGASSRAPIIVREATSDRPVSASSQTDITIKSVEMQPTSVLSFNTPSVAQNLITSDVISTEIKTTLSTPTTVVSSQPPAVVMEVTRPAIEEEDVLLDHNPAFPILPDDLSVPASHDDELIPEQVTDGEPVPVTVLLNQHSTQADLLIVTSSYRENFETDPSPVTQVVASSKSVLVTEERDHSTSPPTMETMTTSSKPTTTAPPATTVTTSAPKSATKISTSTAAVEKSTQMIANTTILEARTGTTQANLKASPMLNLRSAIPTEILNVPSSVQEEINGELDDVIETTTSAADLIPTTTNSGVKITVEEFTTSKEVQSGENPSLTTLALAKDTTIKEVSQSLSSETVETFTPSAETNKPAGIKTLNVQPAPDTTPTPLSTIVSHESIVDARSGTLSSSPLPQEITQTNHDQFQTRPTSTASSLRVTASAASTTHTPSTISVSATSVPDRTTHTVTSTELSSLPVETSDQNPRDTNENITKEVKTVSTDQIAETTEYETTVSDVVTVTKKSIWKEAYPGSLPGSRFTLLWAYPHEVEAEAAAAAAAAASTTDVPAEVSTMKPSAADSAGRDVLSELTDLVGDVASIGEQEQAVTADEELLPVNAGYKSRHQPNANSITELPAKGRAPNEIEEEGPVLVDAVPPGRHEPTTPRTPIDGDGARPPVPSAALPADIEIITRSYVPTISRRPTKVVQAGEADATDTAR